MTVPGPLFDVEICLPVFLEGKWKARLQAFRRHGLLNTSGVRVRLVLLAGTQREARLSRGWPVDEVSVLQDSTDDAAAKIYSYYGRLSLPEIGRARWFLRVDDDSSTDVAGLVRSLDLSYSWREPHHLFAWAVQGEHLADPFPRWLEELGCGHLVSQHFAHDWEVSATSQPALLRALSDTRCRELLRRACALEGNWGDMGLAACCRVAGVSPAPASFLDPGPAWWDFSPFGGEKHHIHGVAPDLAEHWAPFQEKLAAYLAAEGKAQEAKAQEGKALTASAKKPSGPSGVAAKAPAADGGLATSAAPASDGTIRIPRVVHRIWVGNPLAEWAVAWGRTWEANHPDYEMKLWEDAECDELAGLMSEEVRAVYKDSANTGHRSDILRLVILARYGGIYTDCDVENRRAITPLLHNQSAVVATFFEAAVDEHWRAENALMGCVPGHPFFAYVLSQLPAWYWGHREGAVTLRTGPGFIDQMLWQWGSARFRLGEGVAALGNEFLFHPRRWEHSRVDPVPPNAYNVHHSKNSWVEPGMVFAP